MIAVIPSTKTAACWSQIHVSDLVGHMLLVPALADPKFFTANL